jgi:KaiC/GvpD/RAD55 family RecA-like ATPase
LGRGQREGCVGVNRKEYSEKKGIPEDFLRNVCGVGQGVVENKEAVLFPYYDTEKKQKVMRYRTDGPVITKSGDKQTIPYGVWRLKEWDNKCIFIVEGESDCQTMWYWGWPAIGVPGMMWPKNWDNFIKRFEKVYVIKEQDAGGGHRFVEHIGKNSMIVDKMYVFSLPGYKDVSHLHLEKGKQEGETIIIGSLNSAERLGTPLVNNTLEKLRQKKWEGVEFHVNNVIPKGMITLITGKRGSYKTYIAALDLIRAFVEGDDNVWGTFSIQKRPKSILYMEYENGEQVIYSRLQRMIKDPSESNVILNDTVGKILKFDDAHVDKVKKIISQAKPDLIIVDTISSYLVGSEICDEHTRVFMDFVFEHLMGNNERTVILLGHRSSKKQPIESFRQVTRYASNVEDPIASMIVVNTTSNHNEVVLHQDKTRDWEPFNPFRLRVDFEDDDSVKIRFVGFENIDETSEEAKSEIYEKVRTIIGDEWFTITDLEARGKASGVKIQDKSVLRKYLNKLVDDELLKKQRNPGQRGYVYRICGEQQDIEQSGLI